MMNPKRYRSAIEHSIDFAQAHSRLVPHVVDDHTGQLIAERDADCDRLRCFVVVLAGTVQDADPELCAKLMAFVHAQPGQPLVIPSSDEGN